MPAVLPSDGTEAAEGGVWGPRSPDRGKLQSAPQLPEAQAPGHQRLLALRVDRDRDGQDHQGLRAEGSRAQLARWLLTPVPAKAAVNQPWI